LSEPWFDDPRTDLCVERQPRDGVRLSGEERERLETLIRKGGKGWSVNRIIEALETSPSMVYRTRKQLVEDGFEAVLSQSSARCQPLRGFSTARRRPS
jgi:hypothetical protein